MKYGMNFNVPSGYEVISYRLPSVAGEICLINGQPSFVWNPSKKYFILRNIKTYVEIPSFIGYTPTGEYRRVQLGEIYDGPNGPTEWVDTTYPSVDEYLVLKETPCVSLLEYKMGEILDIPDHLITVMINDGGRMTIIQSFNKKMFVGTILIVQNYKHFRVMERNSPCTLT